MYFLFPMLSTSSTAQRELNCYGIILPLKRAQIFENIVLEKGNSY